MYSLGLGLGLSLTTGLGLVISGISLASKIIDTVENIGNCIESFSENVTNKRISKNYERFFKIKNWNYICYICDRKIKRRSDLWTFRCNHHSHKSCYYYN